MSRLEEKIAEKLHIRNRTLLTIESIGAFYLLLLAPVAILGIAKLLGIE